MSNEVSVITIPTNEWLELKAAVKEVLTLAKGLANKEEKELLTPKDVCAILKIGRSTYEKYVNTGVIEAIRVNGQKYSKKYVKRSHIEELIKAGRVIE